jgi:hypothetical protein
MRVAQIILPHASEYERKCQRVDLAALATAHDVIVIAPEEIGGSGADVAHVYGPRELPSAPFVRFPIPYVASGDIKRSRWSLKKPVAPRIIVSPFGGEPLPEAVEEQYFAPHPTQPRERKTVGTFGPNRPGVRSIIDRAIMRLHRTRDDVDWLVFDHPPTPQELYAVDAWIDPASGESDYDGFVAEALVCGRPVIATRFPINNLRLEKGRTGFLVPPGDPNELVHAILAALFKSEVANQKVEGARQTQSKFRPRQRQRILSAIYETLTR